MAFSKVACSPNQSQSKLYRTGAMGF